MIWRPFKRHQAAVREAQARKREAEELLAEAVEQREEVTEAADWAREARQRNHLTELFYRGLAGGAGRG